MRFECQDLDRALAVPELMKEAQEHARGCEACRRALRVWQAISSEAPGLREEWASEELWPRIAEALEREPKKTARKRAVRWQWWMMGAVAASLTLVVWMGPWRSGDRLMLSERALGEVEQAEQAYVASIERLQKVAAPELERERTPLAAAYQEKLIVLDEAIEDLRSAVRKNPYNTSLRLELASLYREKQKTLQESIEREKAN